MGPATSDRPLSANSGPAEPVLFKHTGADLHETVYLCYDVCQLRIWARQRIEAPSILRPFCPDSPEWPQGQMAAFPLPACGGAALQRRLYDGYKVELPVIEWPVLPAPGARAQVCWPGTGNGRQLALWGVSVQGYYTQADVEALIGARRAVLPL